MNKFRAEVDLLYGSLFPICEYSYSKKIYTAEAMMRTRQGNCFTLAEMACRKLMASDEVESAGIVLEAGKRNSHAYCLAFAKNLPGVAILDLVDTKARFPHLTRRTREAVRDQFTAPNSVLYRSVLTSSNTPILKQAVLKVNYQWPANTLNHRVYLPGQLGVTALVALAHAGGMQQNLNRDQIDRQYQSVLPVIPQR